MAKYLDKSGVTYLWNKIKGLFTDQSLNTKNKTYAGAINEINTKVGNLTGAFLWKGKFDTLPAVTNYEAGNVVGVGNKEYVLTVTEGTKAWDELGDEGSYLLKTTAESTYLKKAAGEVKTANLADNAVISTKLAKGARRPIILTPDTTEVDEETYQKLLSNDVDVVFNIGGSPLYLHCKESSGNDISLWFGYIATRPISAEFPYGYSVIVQIIVTISSATPHKLVLSEPSEVAYKPDEFIEKSNLSPILQEIDLTGTDADRKAKLDQFETDWKTLTNAVNPRGARFIGKVNSSEIGVTTVLLRNNVNNNTYEGIIFSDDFSAKIQSVSVDIATGSITITPLFSHLEAITIRTGNTPDAKAANLANIKAYEDNLKAMGVDVTKGYMIPCKFPNSVAGILSSVSNSLIVAITTNGRGELNCYEVYIGGNNPGAVYSIGGFQSKTSSALTTTSKQIVGAINEINALVEKKADKTLNAKSLEAITIRTGNTTDDKAANVAAIKAYVDNLTALGVDTTKGYMIPVKLTNSYHGFIMGTDADGEHTGIIKLRTNSYEGGWIFIDKIGTYRYLECLTSGRNYNNLTTTAKIIVHAINEVNALAKSKQDKLTSGTNIKTVNGQSLLGSGDIAISGSGGDVTAAGDNTFTGKNVFSGIAIADILGGTQYQITGDNGFLMFTRGATNEDIQLSGVATPTYSNSAANKKYVDDKVAAAGGGSAPVLIDIDDISGSAGVSVPVDVFNKIANAASAKTPIFGYSKLVEGPRTTYEIISLYVKNVSTTDTNGVLSIQFIAENAYNSIGIVKRSDTECSILTSSSRPFALDTSVDKSSTRGIQSSAVWKEIHSEPMTVNTAISGVTTLSSTDKHKILCYANFGTQQYNLPPSPVDGETFLFLKVKSGHEITIQSGTDNENIYDCSSGNSVVSKTIASSTKSKITVTYSSTVDKWFLMADDFIS